MENKTKTLAVILKCIALVICLGLVVAGQKSIDYRGVSQMLIGLCGILFLLYLYNRKYR